MSDRFERNTAVPPKKRKAQEQWTPVFPKRQCVDPTSNEISFAEDGCYVTELTPKQKSRMVPWDTLEICNNNLPLGAPSQEYSPFGETDSECPWSWNLPLGQVLQTAIFPEQDQQQLSEDYALALQLSEEEDAQKGQNSVSFRHVVKPVAKQPPPFCMAQECEELVFEKGKHFGYCIEHLLELCPDALETLDNI